MSRAGSPATAVVALRDGHSGKTRLAARFGPRQRRHLITELVRHVVGTLLATDSIENVLVVTGDPRFAADALPLDPRVVVVPQPADRPGLNPAVSLGHRLAVAGGAARVLVIHADLPLLAPTDVHALLEPDAPVVLATDRPGQGTNALRLDATVRGFDFRFGPGSRAAHTRQAAARGLRTAVVSRPGTATDLDTPDDWAALPEAVRDRLDAVLATAVSATTDRGGRRPRPACAGAALPTRALSPRAQDAPR